MPLIPALAAAFLAALFSDAQAAPVRQASVRQTQVFKTAFTGMSQRLAAELNLPSRAPRSASALDAHNPAFRAHVAENFSARQFARDVARLEAYLDARSESGAFKHHDEMERLISVYRTKFELARSDARGLAHAAEVEAALQSPAPPEHWRGRIEKLNVLGELYGRELVQEGLHAARMKVVGEIMRTTAKELRSGAGEETAAAGSRKTSRRGSGLRPSQASGISPKADMILLSNSTNKGSGYLDHAMPSILDWLGPVRELAFVPFALKDHAGYVAKAKERFAKEGITVIGITLDDAGRKALEAARAVFVGGGNTFRLLDRLQASGFLKILKRRVRNGLKYMGASAGTNIAGPTIMTTNDMPIVQPKDFAALEAVPFQINPHYFEPAPGVTIPGETRAERLKEYLEENDRTVVALKEGSWLRVKGGQVKLDGPGAKVFERGADPVDIPGDSVVSRYKR